MKDLTTEVCLLAKWGRTLVLCHLPGHLNVSISYLFHKSDPNIPSFSPGSPNGLVRRIISQSSGAHTCNI